MTNHLNPERVERRARMLLNQAAIGMADTVKPPETYDDAVAILDRVVAIAADSIGRDGTYTDRERADARHVLLTLMEDSLAGRESELLPAMSRREMSIALGVAASFLTHFVAQQVRPLPGEHPEDVDVPATVLAWINDQRAVIEAALNEKESDDE